MEQRSEEDQLGVAVVLFEAGDEENLNKTVAVRVERRTWL